MNGEVSGETYVHEFWVHPPTMTHNVTTNPLGPTISASTNGTHIHYTLLNAFGDVLADGTVHGQTNTWDFARWTLPLGSYTFFTRPMNGEVSGETYVHEFWVHPPTMTHHVTANPLGPTISASTNGTQFHFTLLNAFGGVLRDGTIHGQHGTWNFASEGLPLGSYTFLTRPMNGEVSGETYVHEFWVHPPTMTHNVTTNPLGPTISASTNGTHIHYTLLNAFGDVLADGTVYGQTNTWDFARWTLPLGSYTFLTRPMNGEVSGETYVHEFWLHPPIMTHHVSANPLGPTVTATTNGSSFFFSLFGPYGLVSNCQSVGQSHTWVFSQ
jgi:hypothetical protein